MNMIYWMRRFMVALVTLMVLGHAISASAQVEPRPARQGRKYRVRVDSAPQQAAVYLDDEKYGIVGYTPWSGRLQQGVWKVIVKKDGYEASTRMVEVKRRSKIQETFVPLVRQKVPATLDVSASADPNVSGASVWVDGENKGNVPVSVPMSDGRHLIEVKKDGFDAFSQWITAKEGDRVSMTPMLRQAASAMGAILVDADVAAAEVWLDGTMQQDKTPTMVANVSAGNHVIEVRKPPATAYRETVVVVGGETAKVKAQLNAEPPVRVLSDVTGARVFVDGEDVGAAPQDLSSISSGEHVIEVRAPGYPPREERVTVVPGNPIVLKLDLASGLNAPMGTLRVVSAEPGAQLFIDDVEVGVLPFEQGVTVGPHMVVVVNGDQKMQKKVIIEEGKMLTLDAGLRAVGGIRFSSNPTGADILVDGELVGQTPMVKDDIGAGDHVVIIRKSGFLDNEQMITVASGQTMDINSEMDPAQVGPTENEMKREQRGLTTYGARTLPKGRSAIDMGVGFPYLLNAGITVGAGEILDGQMGLDAGVSFRSFLTRNELAIKARVMLFNQNPFSLGAFAETGFGSSVFDDSKRSGVFLNSGVAASLTGLGAVTLTARAYLNFFSDRHCPEVNSNGDFEADSEPVDTCKKYQDGTLSVEDRNRIDKVFGGEDEIFTRDSGVRFMTSFIVELALQQRWSVWGMLEGAPLQGERPLYLDFFYAPMFERDRGTYFALGTTYKF